MNDQFARRYRDNVMLLQLAEVAEPTSYDKVQLGALMMRYQGQPLLKEIELVIRAWRLTPKELFRQSREIWVNGFRSEDVKVEGSSWDAKPEEE